ncbi:PAS domain S-box protein [Geothrix oryzisoli]|uniref:PAS domain S-box protein n=1 Tax=Geothrix oryzisoli TaxID=2922721 RepID=UPI001FAE750D|nr:PAS domain S-box protein [Geothrix oryzisoli]
MKTHGRREPARSSIRAAAEPPDLYRAFFEASPQGILIHDADGAILGANPAAERVLGIPLGQAQGRSALGPLGKFIHEDGTPCPGMTQPALEALRSGRPVEGVVMGLLHPERGPTTWIEVSAAPVVQPNGGPGRVFTTFMDITERKRGEDALRTSEEKFSKAFQVCPDAITLTRLSDGRYLAANEGFTAILGYTPEEVLGRTSPPGDLGVWVHEADRLQFQTRLRRDGLIRGAEFLLRRKDGGVFPALVSSSTVEIGGEPCVLSITRDITSLQEQAKQLERMTRLFSALSQVNQAIVTSPSREILLDKVCEVMVEFGKFSMAWIGWDDPGSHVVKVVSSHGDRGGYLDGLQIRSDDTPLGQGGTGRAIREGRTCVLNDFLGSHEAAPWHEAAARCGIAASVSLPIRKGGRVCGALMVYAPEKDFFGPQELGLLEEAAGDISFALDHLELESQRRQAEEALRNSSTTLHLVLDTVPHAIFWKDLAGRYLGCNQVFAQVAGLASPEQVVGRTDFELPWSREDAEAYRADDREVVATNQAKLRITEQVQRADGTRIWVATSKAPLRGEDGLPFGVLGVLEDITEVKRAEEALRMSEAFIRTVLDHLPLGIAVNSSVPGTTPTYMNDNFPKHYRTTRERLGGVAANPDLFWEAAYEDPEFREAMKRRVLADFASGDPERLYWSDVPITRQGQEPRYVDAMNILVPDQSLTISLVWDVTERKLMENEQRRLESQLQQAQKMESLGILAGGVAHDMNNVLGAILGLASAHIEDQPEGSPQHQAFETIIRAAERGGKMVKGLLSFARLSPAEEHELDVNAILQEEVRLLERTTLSRVRLEMDLATDLHPIRGDASALAHAFMNLCVNAVDAMPEPGTLTLSTRNLDGGWIEVTVKDTGIGMTKETLEKALDPFFTTKEQGKGTGLGLTMVYSTVKAHHGQVEIQSRPGLGTTVTMRFPTCADPARQSEQAAAPGTQAIVGSRHVLLVDDDELIRSSVQAILEALGHSVSTASSGEEALEKLAAGLEPEAVILDMNMPGLGGAGTLPGLRALRPTLPVLVVTGRADQHVMDLIGAHPFVSLLPKPFTMKDLQRHLEALGRSGPSPL